MPSHFLCTIEKLFDTSFGLIVEPDWTFSESTEMSSLDGFDAEVSLVSPDGSKKACAGRFQIVHVNTLDKFDAGKRWRIVLSLSGITKQDVPIGTQVFADEQVFDQMGHAPGQAAQAPR